MSTELSIESTSTESDTRWFTSSYTSGGAQNCVELGLRRKRHAVRDTKDRSGPHLEFDGPSWYAFVDDVKAGKFDLPS